LTPACASLLEVSGSGFGLLKFLFYDENFILQVGCLDLSVAISAQFIFKLCVAARNHEKFTKIPNFEGSKLFKVINVNKTKKPVASACYDK